LSNLPGEPEHRLTLAAVGRFLLHRTTRYVLAWLLALVTASGMILNGWFAFRDTRRKDGNSGHTTIDFGGQWLMGRMLAKGHGKHLYHRNEQRQVLRADLPREDETPVGERKPEDQQRTDAGDLMSAMVGEDSPDAARIIASFASPLAPGDLLGEMLFLAAGQESWTPDSLAVATTPQIGGPLYPPISAFVMYPFGLFPPRVAYRLIQVFQFFLAFVAGGGICWLTRGRIWWPLAATGVMLYPGFGPSVSLGQNAPLTLTILVWGWALVVHDRPLAGGAVWGLLAFKPVWAMAFFLVPVLTGRWRFALAMAGVGTLLAVATLPAVGVEGWRDWLHIGRVATRVYDTDENWIFLSRDLLSIPRRWLLDFKLPIDQRESLAARLLGWGLLVGVLEVTLRLAMLRRSQLRAATGPPAAFVLLAAWLCCFHFMYYDVLLTALPVFLLFTEPGRWFEPRFVAIFALSPGQVNESVTAYYKPLPLRDYPGTGNALLIGPAQVGVLNSFVMTLLAFMAVVEYLFPVLGIDVNVSAGFLRRSDDQALPAFKLSTDLKGPPWHTFSLLALWLWCGWQVLWEPTRWRDKSR
jgi:hypothetical protein